LQNSQLKGQPLVVKTVVAAFSDFFFQ